MTERAAHVLDHVLPRVPIRQWVLTLPHGIRYRLAFDHAACRRVTAAFLGVVFAWLRRRARRQGVSGGRTGGVVFVQRFGAARSRGRPNPTWAALMQRSFGIDVLACPSCGGRLA